MKKYIFIIIALLLWLVPLPVHAADGVGTIQGHVLNGTDNNTAVAGVTVTLSVYLDNEEQTPMTAQAGQDGGFVFSGLDTNPAYFYQASTPFDGVAYYGELLSFPEGETSLTGDVVVYDVTTSDASIMMAMSHMVLYPQEGSLLVREYYIVINHSQTTYVGGEGHPGTLRFYLPSGAYDIQTTAGPSDIVIAENGFVQTQPVPPGTGEVGFSYSLDMDDSEVIQHKIFYPTSRFDLLISGGDIRASSDQLAPDDSLNISGVEYSHLSAQGLEPGQMLTIDISGAPGAGFPVYIWVILAACVALAGVIIYIVRKRAHAPVPVGEGPTRQERLLDEIAGLDDAFEAGEMPEEEYRKTREAKKTELMDLMQHKQE